MAQTVPARQTVQNMTEGSPVSLILRFALPIFISQVFQQLYSTADAFIVGKYLGTNAFAAVSSSGTLIMLLTSLFIGTAMGAGVAISKYFGAGDYENVSRAIHTNLAFGIVSGTLLTLIGVFLTPTFLVWMNTDAQVMPQAVEYFRYYFLGVLATVLYNMCTSILNALGDSRRPLHYLIISSLVNIALDLLFIGAFHWGVWSAAVATVLSQGTSCVLCLIHLLKKGEIYTVTPRNIRFHAGMLGEIVRYGLLRHPELRHRPCQRHRPVADQLVRYARDGGLRRALQDRGLRVSAYHELHDGLHHIRGAEPRRQAV